MVLSKENTEITGEEKSNLTTSKRRRLRRKKLRTARNVHVTRTKTSNNNQTVQFSDLIKLPSSVTQKILEEKFCSVTVNGVGNGNKETAYICQEDSLITNLLTEMSSKDVTSKPREDVLAARQAKKLSKQKTKQKKEPLQDVKNDLSDSQTESVQKVVVLNTSDIETKKKHKEFNKITEDKSLEKSNKLEGKPIKVTSVSSPKGKDEVDRAVKEDYNIKAETVITSSESKTDDGNILKVVLTTKEDNLESGNKLLNADKAREQIKAERAAKKAAKQTKKKVNDTEGSIKNDNKSIDGLLNNENSSIVKSKVSVDKNKRIGENCDLPIEKDLTVREVVDTLKDIVNVAKEVQAVTDKVKAIDLGGKKSEESGKSKAELKAERRAKQEAQRAAKQAQSKPTATSTDNKEKEAKDKQKHSPKLKTVEKPKLKSQSMHRVNWFQHLYTEHDKEALKKIALNSNLHPAIIKLGVQLASQVVTGSNARCIALLDALKKMVRDYSLPAKTEFARGLESHLAASLEFLWAMRQPSASQTNAVKHFRRQLTQLPNNVDEFDAKKTLQEEIDRYIREQIDMAGEAISIAVRNKISNGDTILTYGCSSLIERILCEAWQSGVRFRAVLSGERVRRGAREMLRRLAAQGLPVTYADISALSFLMRDIDLVILGAGSLLVNGSVLGAVGSAQVALVARSCNVPLLVACETHKFSERVQTDAFVYNEIGDPDDLIDETDENSPLKDWRTNPNLTLLNLTYDVIPPSLVTAVVTELAILPCTSAPVVLRFKLSEYGM